MFNQRYSTTGECSRPRNFAHSSAIGYQQNGLQFNRTPPLFQLQPTRSSVNQGNHPSSFRGMPTSNIPKGYNQITENNSLTEAKFNESPKNSRVFPQKVNNAPLMQPPLPSKPIEGASSKNAERNNDQPGTSKSTNGQISTVDNINVTVGLIGSTQAEKMFIFTGTVERAIKWNKIFRNHFCYYEVFGSVISIQEGTVNQQKIMLLRDKRGPVLQVVYYEITHIVIEDFFVGKVLRCVGNMIGQNMLNAITIRSARESEIENLERLSLICDQAVSHYLNA